jgi:small-conductance mechanosensitive channel
MTTPTRRRFRKGIPQMKIVPASIEQQINRVDRTRSLMIGISCGLVAFWSIYRVIWSLYLAMTYNFLFGSLVFQIVLWGVIGAVAAIAATGFFTRYAKGPTADNESDQP